MMPGLGSTLPPTTHLYARSSELAFPCRSTIRLCAPSSELAFAQRELASVLRTADTLSRHPTSRERVNVPLPYVTFQCTATLCSAIVFAGASAGLLDNACWPASDPSCGASAISGAGAGLLGGAISWQSEQWKQQLDETTTTDDTSTDPLDHAVLFGTLPLQVLSRIGAGDEGVGERALGVVSAAPSRVPRALLLLSGTLASVAWTQGVLQQAMSTQATSLALNVAMRSMPDDPTATWWWPAVASGTVIAPYVAATAAAAVSFTADRVCAGTLRPQATARAEVRAAALATARLRSEQRFLLQAPEEVARRRSQAFDEVAAGWLAQQQDREARRAVAAAIRCVVAAAAYAASGGSILAPVATGLAAGVSSNALARAR